MRSHRCASTFGNGDNLVMIEDPRVATSYAIEALRVFDHLHFRTLMSDAFAGANKDGDPKAAVAKTTRSKAAVTVAPTPDTATPPNKATALAALTLKKPTAISGKPAWFTDFYKADTQQERDRILFSR